MPTTGDPPTLEALAAEVLDDLPGLPTRLGASRGVRRRVRQATTAARVAFASLEVLDEAVARRYGVQLERHRLKWERDAREIVQGEDAPLSLIRLVCGIGANFQEKSATLVDDDEALEKTRQHHRLLAAHRDAAIKNLYHPLARFRHTARGQLRRHPGGLPSELRGETLRDPHLLLHQTVGCLSWAQDTETQPPQPPDVPTDWAAEAAPLAPLRDALATALRQAVRAHEAVPVALAIRDRTLADFDLEYQQGTRLLERFYCLLGMPSLAAAVRPHLQVSGRVGRPAKKAVADSCPDLVERVLARLRA